VDAEGLEEIRGRCEAATPGPWLANWCIAHTGTTIIKEIAYFNLIGGGRNLAEQHPDLQADWAFLRNVRDDVPRLLSEVERLQAEVERLTAALHQERCGYAILGDLVDAGVEAAKEAGDE